MKVGLLSFQIFMLKTQVVQFMKAFKSILQMLCLFCARLGKPSFRISGRNITQLELLGQGGYSYVYRAVDTQGNQFVLKKQICQSQQWLQRYSQQVQLLKASQCPRVVRLEGIFRNQTKRNTQCFMLLQYVNGGTLFDLIAKPPLQEDLLLRVASQVCEALCFLKERGVVHRDIKLQNILIDSQLNIKLCDFGSATMQVIALQKISKQKIYQLEEFFQKNCTQMYRPPEMIDVLKRWEVGHQVDVWMFGCVLYALAFNAHPFFNKGKGASLTGDYQIPSQPKRGRWVKQLIVGMLTPDPRERLKIEEVEKSLLSKTVRMGEWGKAKTSNM